MTADPAENGWGAYMSLLGMYEAQRAELKAARDALEYIEVEESADAMRWKARTALEQSEPDKAGRAE